MGLSISQRILRSHGGGLKASNRPAGVGGATFSGSLPYQPTLLTEQFLHPSQQDTLVG